MVLAVTVVMAVTVAVVPTDTYQLLLPLLLKTMLFRAYSVRKVHTEKAELEDMVEAVAQPRQIPLEIMALMEIKVEVEQMALTEETLPYLKMEKSS